jgi:hypothetical protein
MRFSLVVLLLVAVSMPATAALEQPPEPETNVAPSRTTPPADGVRPEDVMIDDDAIGDVWETISPADAIGITEKDADILPAITSGLSSAELLQEQELLRPQRTTPKEESRVPTKRWRPAVPIRTLFYLGLAVVVIAVLLLKARG